MIVLAMRMCRERTEELQKLPDTPAKRERPPRRVDSPPPIRQTSTGKFESNWLNPQSKAEEKVRKVLMMEAAPTVREGANEATATVEVRVHESAEIWRRDMGAWEEMTSAEFADWRGGAKDIHAATATLAKSLDPQSREIKIERQEMVGDGTKEPASNYNETENGINITLDWDGDALVVQWSAGQPDRKSQSVAIPFSKRFQTQSPSEQAAPSDSDKL